MVGTRSKATAGPSKMMPQVRKINVVRPKQGNLVKSCTQRKTRRNMELGKKEDVKVEANVEPESTRKSIAPRRMRVPFHSSPMKNVHHMKKKNFKTEMEKKDDVKEEENVEPKPMRKTIAPQRMIGCVSSHGQDLPMPINVVSGNLHQPSHEATTTQRIEDAQTSSPSVPFHISPSKAGTCEDVEPSRKTCTVPLELSPCPCPSPPPISLKVKRTYSRLSEPSVMGDSPLPSCSGESQTPTCNSSSVQHDSLFGFANLLSSEQLASISPVHSREECSFPAVGSFVLPCSQGTEDCFPIPGVELDKKKKKKRIARQLDVSTTTYFCFFVKLGMVIDYRLLFSTVIKDCDVVCVGIIQKITRMALDRVHCLASCAHSEQKYHR
uniref:Uncharacterized protein n=1 Tax=Eptatretus burgeri TaxID=7764 RepID=A0A8C4QK29_EPTBU